jgi:peptidoglycan/LPS O-acetylase OafA/YrhL
MIQRIQTVYLIIVLVLGGLLFKLPVYYFDATKFQTQTMVEQYLFPIAAGICIACVAAIFTFKKRKVQKNFCRILLLLELAFLAAGLIVTRMQSVPGFDFHEVRWGALLPVISIVFILLAIRGINKDEELIRSMDRLR